MQTLSFKTQGKREIIDITDSVQLALHTDKTGVCHLTVLHTTAALTTADLDPGTDLDMLDAFEALIPQLKYRHPHDPSHVSDHILSTMIGTSVTQPVEKGRLLLGTWQRIVLVELDGPRARNVVVSFLEESRN
jgi:secondary thiamine-phosphate synthase enzyme